MTPSRHPRVLCALVACVLCVTSCQDGSPDSSPANDASDASDSPPDDALDGDTSGEPAARALVDHAAWQRLDPADDPFDDAPDTVDCDAQAFGEHALDDEDAFAVKSRQCNHLTVSQPTLVGVDAGDRVDIRAWHFGLDAPTGAEAHLALGTATQTLWEQHIPIPSDSALLLDSWTAPEGIAAGTEIFFHFHNHGNNEYYLIEVSVGR